MVYQWQIVNENENVYFKNMKKIIKILSDLALIKIECLQLKNKHVYIIELENSMMNN